MVEAVGIEPTSGCLELGASTRVAHLLVSAVGTPKGRIPVSPARTGSRRHRTWSTSQPARVVTFAPSPQANLGKRGT